MRSQLALLASAGRVSDALQRVRGLSAPTLEERAIRCELEALAGHRETAYRLACEIAGHKAGSQPVVRALTVAGRLSYFAGNATEGQQRLRRARELAAEQGDAVLEAHAYGQHVEALLRFIGVDAASTELAAYRRAAIRAATPSTLATLHRILAEAEVKTGRGHRALRELDLSAVHVAASQDLVAEIQLNFARSATLGLLGEVALAYDCARAAATRAKECGATAFLRSAQVNVAHCETLLGLHDQAAATFGELTAEPLYSEDRQLDIRSSQLILATSTHNWHLAEAIDTQFGPIADARDTVSARWYQLARVSYLLAVGHRDHALQLALSCIAPFLTVDRDFQARAQAAAADSCVAVGDYTRAAQLLAESAIGPLGTLPEFIATTHRISGRLSSDSPTTAFEHFERAARIFGHLNHLSGRAEALYDAASYRETLSTDAAQPLPLTILAYYDRPASSFGRIDDPAYAESENPSEAVASASRGAAALVDLASRPALAAFEFLRLAASSAAASTGVLLSRRGDSVELLGWIGSDLPDASLRRQPTGVVSTSFGSERDREIVVVIRPSNDQSSRTTLLSLQRLAIHGSALHRIALSENEKSALWPEPLPEQQLGFVCSSETMLELLRATRRVAAGSITVLVTGETGTGKELLARAIHNCSPRSRHRFLPFNCTAVPREMLDSQLFGYRRGAFTGAHDAFPGVIRSATGGTLFLDEIGEISSEVQPKLLRFLESSEVHPLGEAAPLQVDVRIVAATNANLDLLVKNGRFREDLYYRLNVVTLPIPPLRERREDIPPLVEYFLARSLKESSKQNIRISDTTAEYLLLYDWPGNVRELANEIRRVVALSEPGAVIMPEHLSPRIAASRRTVPVGQRPPTPTELLVRRDQPLSAALEHVERAMIMDALRLHGNVEDAAKALGLSRKGLYLKRQRLKIDEV